MFHVKHSMLQHISEGQPYTFLDKRLDSFYKSGQRLFTGTKNSDANNEQDIVLWQSAGREKWYVSRETF